MYIGYYKKLQTSYNLISYIDSTYFLTVIIQDAIPSLYIDFFPMAYNSRAHGVHTSPNIENILYNLLKSKIQKLDQQEQIVEVNNNIIDNVEAWVENFTLSDCELETSNDEDLYESYDEIDDEFNDS